MMFAAWSPDLDAIPGPITNLLFLHHAWDLAVLEYYHRFFTHGLLFLGSSVILTGLLYRSVHNQTQTLENGKMEKSAEIGLLGNRSARLTLPARKYLGFFIALFFFFNDLNPIWMWGIIGCMIGAMIGFGRSTNRGQQPIYGFGFFLGMITHQLLDFINCEWNPFGPWTMGIVWGLFLYCGPCGYCDAFNLTIPPASPATYWFWLVTLEVIPHIVALIVFLRVIHEYKLRSPPQPT
jgi:hypothetical protein